MPIIADLKQEIAGATTLRYITNTFKEISAIKIKDLRQSFEKNKLFFDEIIEVYHVLKLSAARSKLAKLKEKEKEQRKILGKFKTLSIAATSNRRFYGRLNLNVIKEFLRETSNSKTDRLVIGKRGVEHMKALLPEKSTQPFETFFFQKDFPSGKEVDTVIDRTKQYDTVLLYYPRFITVFVQKVGVLDITQTPTMGEIEKEEEVHFIFEPELEQILTFFEKQMRYLLFSRAMLESELSRTAARLMTMSMADERAENLIKEKQFELDKAQKSLENARLLETFAGMRKWR